LSGLPYSAGSLLYGFGVYDGHGKSSAIADLCARKLLRSVSKCVHSEIYLSSVSDQPKSNGIESAVKGLGSERFDEHAKKLLTHAFSGLREELDKFQGVRVGSTATVVLVSRAPKALEWRVTCGWVGDSRGIVIGPDKTQVTALSEDHTLRLAREHQRVVQVQRDEAATAKPGRRPTVVAHRVNDQTGEKGPKVLFNEGTGVSTVVTRSLGDSQAASALSDEPDFTHATVAAGSRLVLASDGVWDAMANNEVAAAIRHIADPLKAARVLCKVAKQRRLYGGFTADDISAVVINLYGDE